MEHVLRMLDEKWPKKILVVAKEEKERGKQKCNNSGKTTNLEKIEKYEDLLIFLYNNTSYKLQDVRSKSSLIENRGKT